ncbi:DUF2563 family protein [soil metagenome]
MFVDPAEMRCGANLSYNASSIAKSGNDKFSRKGLPSGIFGTFAEAESFHEALGAAHSGHVERMKDHETCLGALGDKVHQAASAFAEMDDHNAEAVRAVWCNSDT